MPSDLLSFCNQKFGSRCLLIIPVLLVHEEKQIGTNALLDIGSNITLVRRDLVDELGCESAPAGRLQLTGIGGYGRVEKSSICSFHIRGKNKSRLLEILDARILSDIAGNTRIPDNTERIKRDFGIDADLAPFEDGRVGILIGLDHANLICASEWKYPKVGGPLAYNTALGWVYSAMVDLNPAPTAALIHEDLRAEHGDNFLSDDQSELDESLRLLRAIHDRTERFWRAEGMDELDSTRTVEEDYALELLESTYRVENGRAIVSPLWKPGMPRKGLNNFRYVHKRQTNGLSGMSEDTFDQINAIFEDYLEKDLIEEVEIQNPFEGEHLFWAHFPVYRADSETTKCRPVMDGKARCLEGKSLNDLCFSAGPSLMCDLTQVLTRFRRFDVAFTGDISKMFLKILVPVEQRKYHRFLWFTKGEHKPRYFQYTGHLFGNQGSPTCAMFATRKNAENHADKYPRAAETIMESTIVDDSLDSVPSAKEAVKVIQDLLAINSAIGLTWAKIATNSPEVVKALPDTCKLSEAMVDLGNLSGEEGIECAPGNVPKEPIMRTLGQFWNIKNDSFSFKTFTPDENMEWNKLRCLSQAHSIFDPLGYASGILFEARAIIQELWRQKYEWKDPLQPAELDRWKCWLKNLPELDKLVFDRVLFPGDPETYRSKQLHIFADASQDAYSAVAYVRVELADDKVHTNFVMCRFKLKPLQAKNTIPKLELMAITLATVLAKHIMTPLGIAVEDTTIWSDSKTAIQWLNMDPNRLVRFVYNRVATIRDFIPVRQIRWVDGHLNPADLPTRCRTVKEVIACPVWRSGPPFLRLTEDKWPELDELKPKVSSNLSEEEREFLNCGLKSTDKFKGFSFKVVDGLKPLNDADSTESHFLEAANYKDYRSMRRTIGMVERYLRILREKALETRARGYPRPKLSEKVVKAHAKSLPDPPFRVTEQELLAGEHRIWWFHQQNYFRKSLEEIERKNQVALSNKLRRLGPVLVPHEFGVLNDAGHRYKILRLGGRICAEGLDERGIKKPVLIHPADKLCEMMVSYYHQHVLLHTGGIKCLMCELNKSVWVAGSLVYLKRILRSCVKCRKAQPHPKPPVMAPLPIERVPSPRHRIVPFETTACDCAGPWQIKAEGRGRISPKRWMLIFRCAMYGAIHIEVLRDMSTDAFLLAFERFINTRTRPKKLICDNGTNFVGAERVYQEMWAQVERKHAAMDFVFNPPFAPHFGGLIERMVQESKKILKVIMPDPADVSDDLLETLFKKVQNLLNNRPLAYEPNKDDPLDPLPVCPNTFLLGNDGIWEDMFPSTTISGSKTLAKRLQLLYSLLGKFWERYVGEMKRHLLPYHKWLVNRRDFVVGDVVVAMDPSEPNRYVLGTVVKVFPSTTDGVVRSVDLRVKGQIYRRAAHHLYLVLSTDKAEVDVSTDKVVDDDPTAPVASRTRRRRKQEVYLCQILSS